MGRVLAESKTYTRLALSQFQRFFLGRAYTPEAMYDWSKVAQWFEGYENPFTVFKVVIDGQEYWFSVAELCHFSSSQAISAEIAIAEVLSRLIDEGILSRTFVQPPDSAMRGNVVQMNGFDSRWRTPRDFFKFPNFDFYFKHEELASRTMPVPKVHSCELFLGPNFFNTRDYSNSALINDMVTLSAAIESKHRAANCNPTFAPFISLGCSMHDNSALFEYFDSNAAVTREAMRTTNRLLGSAGLNASRLSRIPQSSSREVNRYTFQGLYGAGFNQNELNMIARWDLVDPIETRYTRLIEPPGRSRYYNRDRTVRTSFQVNRTAPTVNPSLDRRGRVYHRDGITCWITDIATEFLQLAVMGQAVRLVPCHVLLHGNMQFYHECLTMAYGTTMFDSTSAINNYVVNVESENAIRRQMRDSAVGDAIGYTAVAGLDIYSSKTMGTAMLAASNGQANRTSPFASAMRAYEALDRAVNPPRDVERRDLFVLQDGVPPRWFENNWLPWLDPRVVIDSRPFERID